MATKEILVKKYVVRLSDGEREQLAALMRKGSSPAAAPSEGADLVKGGPSGKPAKDGATTRSLMLWQPAHPWSTGCANNWSKKGFEAVLSRKAPAAPARAADFRRREGGQADRSGLLQTARGIRALELAPAGEQGGGTRHRRGRQRLNDPARAQKNALQPHRRKYWVIPPKASGAFVAAMEDVLSVYTRPRDPDRPLVCLDETSKQLVAETRSPVAMRPGRPARVDYEYTRNGVANLFMMFAPLEGWRHVKVTDRRDRRRLRPRSERLGRCPLRAG